MTDTAPRNSDAILGGQTPPPTSGAILGGLEGAKQRLESEAVVARLTALNDAFQYGDRAIDSGREKSYDLSQFEVLVKDPRLTELEALVFQIDYNYWDKDHTFGVALEAICDAQELMPNLKALFVGDREGDRSLEYRKSKVRVFDIRPFLEAFPKLEVFQCYGFFAEYTLECEGLRHESLKTLIIETSDILHKNIEQLCTMDLPELEYFEFWMGRDYHSNGNLISIMAPVLAGYVYPKLKYLGICSSEGFNVAELLNSPIVNQLAVLDFKMGTFGDSIISEFIDHPNLQSLKLLDLSGNRLSEDAIAQIAQLSQLPFQVKTDNQDNAEYEGARHWALYE
jgi:hypothetical protein